MPLADGTRGVVRGAGTTAGKTLALLSSVMSRSNMYRYLNMSHAWFMNDG